MSSKKLAMTDSYLNLAIRQNRLRTSVTLDKARGRKMRKKRKMARRSRAEDAPEAEAKAVEEKPKKPISRAEDDASQATNSKMSQKMLFATAKTEKLKEELFSEQHIRNEGDQLSLIKAEIRRENDPESNPQKFKTLSEAEIARVSPADPNAPDKQTRSQRHHTLNQPKLYRKVRVTGCSYVVTESQRGLQTAGPRLEPTRTGAEGALGDKERVDDEVVEEEEVRDEGAKPEEESERSGNGRMEGEGVAPEDESKGGGMESRGVEQDKGQCKDQEEEPKTASVKPEKKEEIHSQEEDEGAEPTRSKYKSGRKEKMREEFENVYKSIDRIRDFVNQSSKKEDPMIQTQAPKYFSRKRAKMKSLYQSEQGRRVTRSDAPDPAHGQEAQAESPAAAGLAGAEGADTGNRRHHRRDRPDRARRPKADEKVSRAQEIESQKVEHGSVRNRAQDGFATRAQEAGSVLGEHHIQGEPRRPRIAAEVLEARAQAAGGQDGQNG